MRLNFIFKKLKNDLTNNQTWIFYSDLTSHKLQTVKRIELINKLINKLISINNLINMKL